MCAAVPSRVVVWQRSALEYMLVKDVHLATVLTTLISTDITRKLYAMNAKLRTGQTKASGGSDAATGRSLDIRLPGIAGKLSQMDSRQLEMFCETQKKDVLGNLDNAAGNSSDKRHHKLGKLAEAFTKAKSGSRAETPVPEVGDTNELEPVLPPPTTATSKLIRQGLVTFNCFFDSTKEMPFFISLI